MADYEVEVHKARADGRKAGAVRKPGPCPKTAPVTTGVVNNAVQALKSLVKVDANTERPVWLSPTPPFPAEGVLPFSNGLVSLPSYLAGGVVHHVPHTPAFFSGRKALPFAFDPAAPRPGSWLEFLDQLWPHDPESVACLQEWMGLILTDDTTRQKMLLLVGPPRSGKGTVARVCRALVGEENVAGPTLASLGNEFALQALVEKPLAIIPDARMPRFADHGGLAEKLLAVSGEDTLTVNRKFLPQISVKLPTRLMMLTNELPDVDDSSGALASRFIVLRLTRSWLGKEDTGLFGKLEGELPGIMLWAIEGLRRLRERGRFEQPASARETVEDLTNLTSPVSQFVKECCVLAPDGSVPASDLFRRWQSWCSATGNGCGTTQVFGKKLKAACPGVRLEQRRAQGQVGRVYNGIVLSKGPG
jgi:putative DNA primase/helicase